MFFFERFLFVSGKATWNVALAVRLRGPLDPAVLRIALDALQARHPALRAGVEIRDRPFFVTAPVPPPIPLAIAVRRDDDTWLGEAWSQRRAPFALPDGPLARLLWIRPETGDDAPCELVLTCHHCICDGMSLVLVMRELLQRLAQPGMPVTPLPDVAPFAAPRPAHASARLGRRVRDEAVVVAARLLLPAARLLPRRSFGSDHLLRWEIDETTTRALDRRCWLERTTATLAIAVAVLRAFRLVRSGSEHNRLLCPVDLRFQLPAIGPDQLFPIAEAIALSLEPRELPFWAQARKLRDSLFERRSRLDPARRLALAERLHVVLDRLVELQRHGRSRQDAALSVLGPLDFPRGRGPLSLQAVLGGFSAMPWRDATGIYTMRNAGCMSFILVSREDLLSRAEAERLRDQITAILARAASEPASAAISRNPRPKTVVGRDGRQTR